MSVFKYVKWLLVSVAVVMLTACGGGGSSGGDDDKAEINTPPVAKSVELQTNSEVSIIGSFDVSDSEDSHFKYYVVTEPLQGSVVVDEDNKVFTYTPKAGFTGTDTFTYKAYDGKVYSNEVEVIIKVTQITVNASDTIAPTKATILSLNSSSSNKITLFWLGSTDDATASDDLLYEVHCSTLPNFTADASTRKYIVKGALEADVPALQEDTLYYVKVKTVDAGANEAISSEMNITTSMPGAVVLNSSSSVKKADDLFLHDAVTTDISITYPKTDKSIVPNVGDILVGDSKSRTLKKVSKIVESTSHIELITSKTSLTQVLQKASFESKTLLIDENTSLPGGSSKHMKVAYTNNLNGSSSLQHNWGSGRFSIKSDDGTVKPNQLLIKRREKITDTSDGLSISSSSSKYAAYPNRANYIMVEVEHTSINTDTKIQSFSIKEIEYDGNILSGNGMFQMTTNKTDSKHWSGKIGFYPNVNHVSPKPYTITLEAEEYDADFASVDNNVEIKLEVFILTKSTGVDSTKEHTLSIGTNAEVKAKVDFTPLVTAKLDIEGSSLTYGKISVGGQLTLDVKASLQYTASAQINQTFPLGSKSFKNAYLIGTIPVYQETTISWKATVMGHIDGSIDQKVDLSKVYTANFGVEYINGQWQKLESSGGDSDLTSTITVGAEGMLEVRLIPEIKVTFYEVASSALTIEPWADIDFVAHGTAAYNTDFTSYDASLEYGLDKLTSNIGLDVNMYVSIDIIDINIYRYPKSGYENLVALQKEIFSLPTLKIDTTPLPVKDQDLLLTATTKNGTFNAFDASAIQWKVFPSNGASIIRDVTDFKKAYFNFSKFDEYTIIFVGASEQLGSTFGRQYTTIIIDARDLDGDQMADRWEEENGLNPLDGTEGDSDKDGDGYSNLLEYQSGTDPDDENDHPGGDPDLDTVPPVITIQGSNPATVIQGDTYNDAGATAVDNTDGDVNVIQTGSVDTDTIGDYSITYTARDSAGNEVNETRTVNVVEAANTPPTANAGTDQSVTEGDSVTLDGSGSSDSDGTILSYVWKEGSSTLATTQSFTKADFAVGVHTLTLTVSDDDNAAASDSVSITVNAAGSRSSQVKKTGQTTSYTNYDDGYYKSGVLHSYTRDDDKKIVTDHVTGLVWQDDEATKIVTKQWITDANYDAGNYSNTSGDTATTYCTNLTLGNYTDWRLPTIIELQGITLEGRYDPTIDAIVFNNTNTSTGYWSSTAHALNPNRAWHLYFYRGSTDGSLKKWKSYVRCVREGE